MIRISIIFHVYCVYRYIIHIVVRPGRTLTELLLCGLCGHRPQSHHHGAAGDESKWEKGDGFDVRLPSFFAMKLLTWGCFCCFFSDGPKNRERRTASKHAFFSCVCLGLALGPWLMIFIPKIADFEPIWSLWKLATVNIDIACGKRIFSMHQTANLVSKWSARVSIPVVSGQKVAPEYATPLKRISWSWLIWLANIWPFWSWRLQKF